jgi:hypothetical protein
MLNIFCIYISFLPLDFMSLCNLCGLGLQSFNCKIMHIQNILLDVGPTFTGIVREAEVTFVSCCLLIGYIFHDYIQLKIEFLKVV